MNILKVLLFIIYINYTNSFIILPYNKKININKIYNLQKPINKYTLLYQKKKI